MEVNPVQLVGATRADGGAVTAHSWRMQAAAAVAHCGGQAEWLAGAIRADGGVVLAHAGSSLAMQAGLQVPSGPMEAYDGACRWQVKQLLGAAGIMAGRSHQGRRRHTMAHAGGK